MTSSRAFDWLSDNNESRRKMAYCYLMSRLIQHEDTEKKHYGLISERWFFQTVGVFREAEKRNISKYIDILKHYASLFLVFSFKLGSAQRCHRLGSENGILVGKG